MTYLITAKNLFSATIIINSLKEECKTNHECKFIINSPLSIEVTYRYIEYSNIRKLLKKHVDKFIYINRLKNQLNIMEL